MHKEGKLRKIKINFKDIVVIVVKKIENMKRADGIIKMWAEEE